MRGLDAMLDHTHNTGSFRVLDFLCHALAVVLFVFSLSATAQEPPVTIPTISAIENQIEQVRNNPGLSDSERAATIELLQTAITRSNAAAEANKSADRYAKALTQAPLEQAAFEAQVAKFSADKLPGDLSEAPLEELQALLNREEVALVGLRNRRAQIEVDTKNEKSFDIQAALDEARAQLPPESPLNDVSDERQAAQRTLAATTRYLQQARIAMLEQRLLSRNARLAVAEAEQKVLAKQIAAAETRVVQLQALVTDNRQSEARRTAAQARETLNSLNDEPAAIREIGVEIVAHANQLENLVASHDRVIHETTGAAQEERRLEQKYSSLTEQLEIAQLESSPEFGAALRKQRDQLAGVEHAQRRLDKLERTLTESRLAQFQLDALLDPEAQPDADTIIAQIRLDPTIPLTSEQMDTIRKLIEQRSAILEQLSAAYSSYIEDLTNLITLRHKSIEQSNQYAALLDQHLLWMPSTDIVDLRTLTALRASMVWLLNPDSWAELVDTVATRLQDYPFATLLVIVVLFVLLFRRRYLVATLAAMKGRTGRVNKDRMSLTVIALLATFLLALPGPLAMLSIAALEHGSGSFSEALTDALINSAWVYLILEFLLQSVRRNGLVELHFAWDPITVTALRRNLPWFMAVFIPAMLLNLLIEAQDNPIIWNSLGRVAFVAATLVLTTFAYRVLDPGRGILRLNRPASSPISDWEIRYLVFPVVVLLPLLLAGMSLYRYHYTAVRLGEYLLHSTLVVAVGILLFSLAQRAIAINERRLALERVRAKRAAALAASQDREAAAASGEGVLTEMDLQEIDLHTISEQTRDLLKMAVAVGIALALWNVWSGLLPAFKPLQNIELWTVVELVDGAPITTAVTLWDLLLTLAVGVITFLAVKNIPGLLEVALLSRLSLATGTSYAITTLARYLIVITGSVIGLQLLGAQWSKLQWLVAALGVGLGFGLQEIVANFVSGIVILFERPIRIGDTVTVGDQWGTVSRIRIRATTIVDWDRREIIIPNKTFITERLVNWTLTDPITRSTIRVGVAYGSDIALVEKLLLDIAQANARVLEDPPPAALFLNFGDSSLDFELRVFVKGIRDLIPANHELHVAIDREFRANGVEIAFPQRDVHFDSKGIEVRLIEPDDNT